MTSVFPLTPSVSVGYITGNIRALIGDVPTDSDNEPDSQTIAGATLTFEANVSRVTVATDKIIYIPRPVVATFSSEDGTLQLNGASPIELVSPKNPALNPQDWTWKATFRSSDSTISSFSFNFTFEPGQTVDLSEIVPIPSSEGRAITVGRGFPEGGTIGQVLVKASASDYDTIWSDVASGGGAGGIPVGGVVHVDNPTGPRPTDRTDVMVMWIGGTVAPTNMLDGDLWFAEGAPTPVTAPSIVTSSLPGMTVGIAFSANLVATGTTPITWAITSGTLPAGLTMSTSGQITGTPTAAGSYSVTIRATNSGGNVSRTYTGTVAATASAPNIQALTINAMTVGTSFTQVLAATGTAPITWSYTGTLPPGLTLSSSGTFTGTPTTAGSYSFTVTATNAQGANSKAFTQTVAASSGGSGGQHSIWGATVPYSGLARLTDGTPNIEIATGFYPLAGGAGWKVVGVRVYVPAGTAPASIPVKVYGPTTGAPTLGSGWVASGTITAPIAGQWNEATLDTPVPFVTGQILYASYDAGGGVYYADATVAIGATYVQASDGSPFVMSDSDPGVGAARRYHHRIGTGAVNIPANPSAIWYGTDIVVEAP